jgi:type II secretory pathway component PulC
MTHGEPNSSRWLERLPTLTAGVLALLIVLDCAHSVASLRRILAGGDSPAAIPARAVRPFHLKKVLRAHLFGQAPDPAVPQSNAPAAAQWILTGTIATSDPGNGWAILGERNKRTSTEHAGSELAVGLRLAQVFAHYVVLEGNGQREILRLPRSLKPGTLLVADAAAPAPDLPSSTPTDGLDGPPVLSRGEDWFSNFHGDAVHINGQAVGLELHPGSKYRRRYGIEPGDVLTAIDGVPVTDDDSAAGVLREASGHSLTLTINRGGHEVQTTVATGN